jgi:DNA (cytosine-5)-methyltransferase 1
VEIIPVIDVFAGPGGLGEGFSSFRTKRGAARFRLGLSIEKEKWAVATLRLRSFQRALGRSLPTPVQGTLDGKLLQQLTLKHPDVARRSIDETWHIALSPDPHTIMNVRKRIASCLDANKPWVLIGGPPCQAYSLAGRSRNRGISDYVPEDDHRQTLYIEYLQLIADHQPQVFVMENVKGLLSAQLHSTRLFERILDDLRDPAVALRRSARSSFGRRRPRYRIIPIVQKNSPGAHRRSEAAEPADYVVKAERFGVPQARHRVILVGIQESSGIYDIGTLEGAVPPSVRETIGDLPRLRSGITDQDDTDANWRETLRQVGSAAWLAACDYDLQRDLKLLAKAPKVPRARRGSEFVACEVNADSMARRWGGVVDGGVVNHSARAHMTTDLQRYFFLSAWAKRNGKSPSIADFPGALLPDHANVLSAIDGSNFADRFRVQAGDRPATTITSHISKDGHYYIHYDPRQCRSLTVREAARLQSFPDDYVFLGPRTAQYQQVGNAVPPYLARQIARIVSDAIG